MALKTRTYPREVFFAAYGAGPYECYFCREQTVEFDAVCVHHLNEDRGCNHPYNLAPAHLGCHNRWHNSLRKGVPRSAIVRAKISEAKTGVKQTAETCAKKSAVSRSRWAKASPEQRAAFSWQGRRHSPESRAKMSAARRAYWDRKRAAA